MSFAKSGTEHLVNTTIAGDQYESAVVQLTGGDIVVAWTDKNGSAVNVRGQRFNSDGVTKDGSEFMLNTTLTGDQFDVSLAALGNGGFVAGWTSSADWQTPFPLLDATGTADDGYQNHVVTQVFNSSGAKTGGEEDYSLFIYDYSFRPDYLLPEIELTEFLQGSTALTANRSINSDDFDLFAADSVHYTDHNLFLFTPPIATWINEEGGENNLVHYSDGDAEIVNSKSEGTTYDFATSYSVILGNDPPGYASLDEFANPVAITLEDGDVVTAYERISWDSTSTASWRVIEIWIDFGGSSAPIHVGDDYSGSPSLSELENGNVILVWKDGDLFSGDPDDIKGQLFTADGAKIGGEFSIDSSSSDTTTPAVAGLTDGRFIVVWEDLAGDGSGSAIKAQVFTEDGVKSGESFTVNTSTPDDQRNPTVTALANGDAFVTWTDYDGATPDIYSQVLDLQTYVGDSSAETVYGGTLDDHLDGGDGADVLYGNQGNDTFESVTMDDLTDGDVFDGGTGTDTLDFDDYILDWGGPPVLIGDNGTVTSVEVINLHGPTAGAGINNIDIAIPLANTTSTNTLTVNGAQALDIINADRISNTAVTVTLNGGGGDDQLYGGAGANHLDGGTGADYMHGGVGNDTYTVDSTGDEVVEDWFQGTDLILSSVDYTLGDDVENLTLTGAFDIDGTGNGSNNIIYGNSEDNRIDGLGGSDHLYGQGGFDIIHGGDRTDWLYGGAGDDNLYGDEYGDVLIGGTEDDELDGGAGEDYMRGDSGSDLYVVDSKGDQVVELNNQGDADMVLSSINLVIPAFVENLWLTGTANLAGIGNLLDNTIVGNQGINVITGAVGDDFLAGFGGNDLLWGGIGADTLDGGTESDTASYAGSSAGVYVDLGGLIAQGGDSSGDVLTNIENLIGSVFVDTLVGDNNANWLDGGKDADILGGGGGNDTYVVDDALDIVIEIGGGIDTVRTSLTTFTLGTDLDKLVFTSNLINAGTGNILDNTLTGNDQTDTLSGLSGDDDLFGKDGNDVLRGGIGADDLDGGLGIADLADYIGATTAVTAALDGSLAGSGEALGDTFTDIERLRGSNFADTLTGDGLDNILFGQDGTDTINGLAGVDRLIGGNGIDTLTGGSEADRFEFATLTEIGDIIADFTAVDDTIVVTGAAFGGGLIAGTLNAAFFQSRADNAAQDADDRFILRTTDNTLWFDADGNGAGAAVMVADLQASATMTNVDILIV